MKTVLITGSNGQLGEACKLNLRSKFNLIFWLGDDTTLATGNRSFTFGLPVISKDKQI